MMAFFVHEIFLATKIYSNIYYSHVAKRLFVFKRSGASNKVTAVKRGLYFMIFFSIFASFLFSLLNKGLVT